MRNVFCTPQGAIKRDFGCFLAPSGCPFIDIYQAGAQRTLGLLLCFTASKPFAARGGIGFHTWLPDGHIEDAGKISGYYRTRLAATSSATSSQQQCDQHAQEGRDALGANTACALCGRSVKNSLTGRPRTYCSAACRQKAYRNRLLLRNPLSRALEGVSLQLSAIRDPGTAHSAISDPAAANEFTWQACTGDSRA